MAGGFVGGSIQLEQGRAATVRAVEPAGPARRGHAVEGNEEDQCAAL